MARKAKSPVALDPCLVEGEPVRTQQQHRERQEARDEAYESPTFAAHVHALHVNPE